MEAFLGKDKLNIHISTWSIVKVFLVFLAAWFLFTIRDVIAIVFVSLILAASLDPWVDKMEKLKIPRGISVVMIYILLFAFITLVLVLLVPAIAAQLQEISKEVPNIYGKLVEFVSTSQGAITEDNITAELQENLQFLQATLIQATGNVFGALVGIFGGIISFLSVLVITFYITVEEEAIKRVVIFSVPAKHQGYILSLINRVQKKIGLWLRGQLILMFIIGLLTYVSLKIIGVDYALVLALLAGIAEFIPFLGPLIAAIPAVFVAFVQKPILALFVVIVYSIIQQAENNLIVPKVMQKAVGLNPLVVIVALLVGGQVAGVVGAILAIPVTTALSVIARDKLGFKEVAE